MRDIDRAWLAAVVDAEGSIIVSRIKQGPQVKRGYSFRATLSISNTNEDFLQHVKQIIGTGNLCRLPEHRKNWKDKFQYLANANTLRAILPEILPYLIIKREQAKLVLEFLSQINVGIRGDYPNDLQVLYSRIRTLNAKGKDAKLVVPYC